MNGNAPDLLAHGLLHLQGDVERRASRAVDHQQVAGGAAQVGHPQLLEVVVAVDVPQHQGHVDAVDRQRLLVDLDAHRREVLVGEHTADEAGDQAGLAH